MILGTGMTRTLLATASLLFLLVSAACSGGAPETAANSAPTAPAANTSAPGANQAQPPAKALPEDVVRVVVSKVEVQAGKTAPATVRLAILEGYHINGNPASQYQIATQLTVEPSDGLTTGAPVYPASLTKKFQFSEQPLAVYEGEATINVPVTATAGAAKGERNVSARLRFQACDEQVCYPPKNLQTVIPVVVK